MGSADGKDAAPEVKADARAPSAKTAKSARKPASTRRQPSAKPSRKARAALALRPPLWRRVTRRIVKWTFILIVLLILAPIGLTFLYSVPGVQPVSTLMMARVVEGEPMQRDWVAFEDVAPPVWQSVVSSEDGQYCAHDGVDWAAVNEVIDGALEGERVRGASTIPMQVVKNLYLWPSRSYVRKGLEVPLAMLVDKVWTKRRTMEIYLNIAEWGPGIFGIEAAAQHHFGQTAARLTGKQAALLAVSLPNPIERNAGRPGPGLQKLGRMVERRASASGAYVKCLANS